jgi:hypothetical protein
MPIFSRSPCSSRYRLFTLASVAILSLALLAACGGGGGGGSNSGGGSGSGGGGTNPPPPPPPPPVNRAPTAANDAIRIDIAGLASINVLANDVDPDGDKLTVSITEPALIGVATANADGTVTLASLPSDFKGYTRFKYRVTDAGGLTSDATAAIFLGVEPFRVVLAGDPASNGSNELYLADLVTAPAQITSATEGAMRLTGFVASTDGSTVVYRRASTATPTTADLSFVRTATPKQDARVVFPGGAVLVQGPDGRNQFAVSSDGRWIAAIARDGSNVDAAYVLNVSSPSTVTKVSIPGALRASLPRFSNDSQRLYLLASPVASAENDDLFTVSLATMAVTQVSQPTAVNTNNDVLDYSVASDQSRILIRANRGGRIGLYYINPAQLQVEVKVSHDLGLLDTIRETTVGLPLNAGGSVLTQHVAYTVETTLLGFSTYVADVSSTPNPRLLAGSGARVRGFRPDDVALTYARSGQIVESALDGSVSDQNIGAGMANWYDSTGNIVLLQQQLPSGGSPSTYPALAVAVRGSFGTPIPLGTPALAAHYVDASGFDRGIVIIGEGATTGTPPNSAKLALVNAMAPDKLIPLADFSSPLQLQASASQVVKN